MSASLRGHKLTHSVLVIGGTQCSSTLRTTRMSSIWAFPLVSSEQRVANSIGANAEGTQHESLLYRSCSRPALSYSCVDTFKIGGFHVATHWRTEAARRNVQTARQAKTVAIVSSSNCYCVSRYTLSPVIMIYTNYPKTHPHNDVDSAGFALY